MKKVILLIALALISMTPAQAQMKAQWHNGNGKRVCAAYNYGQFTGNTGRRHKYVPRGGRKLVRGRSHSTMRFHARKRQQKSLVLFKAN